jgi:4-oxalocrotonate tautomerase family enzyme
LRKATHYGEDEVAQMPLVHVTVPEGSLSDARKQLMVEKITEATLEAEGLPSNERTRMLTWVIINEVKDGNWGAGGGVVRLSDIAKAFGISDANPRAPEPEPASVS